MRAEPYVLKVWILVLATLLPCAHSWAEVQQVAGLEFSNVLVYGDAEVEISQGEETLLLIRGASDRLDMQPFFLSDDTLVLGRSRDQDAGSFADVKFKLTVRELEHLQLKGAGNIYLRPVHLRDLHIALTGSGDLKLFAVHAEELVLALSGSGDIQAAKLAAAELKILLSGSGDVQVGELHAQEIEASLKGSGDISLQHESKTTELELNLVGSGDIDFASLDSVATEIHIVGSGSARVGNSDELEVKILGSGDVYYRGSPDIDRSVLGSGDVRREQ